jgi:hypothetical protein
MIGAIQQFGMSSALSRLSIEMFLALGKDLGFQARTDRAWEGEDRTVQADDRVRRRVMARLDREITELLSVLGHDGLCCYLGEEAWKDIMEKTRSWAAKGGDPTDRRNTNGAVS